MESTKRAILRNLLWGSLFTIVSSTIPYAQNCDGEIGAEIFLDDLGSGDGPGPCLPPATTDYICGSIGGGNYVVSNTTGLNGALWHDSADHTPGDVNGYCLVFDTSFSPGVFYTRQFEDLCPSTNYTFSCFVANLVRPFACGGNSLTPNLRFTLYDPATLAELGAVSTGNIGTSTEIEWLQFSISFTTAIDQEEVLLEITNNNLGGCGNDLAIDDFSLNICSPVLEQEFDLCSLPENMIQVGTEVYSEPGFYETIIALPNSCHDSIVYTTLYSSGSTNFEQFISLCQGETITINGQTYASDTIVVDTVFTNPNCLETFSYIIEQDSEIITNEEIIVCAGDSVLIFGNWEFAEGVFRDTLISVDGCDSIIVVDLQVSEFSIALSTPIITLSPGEGIDLLVTSTPAVDAQYQWSPSEFFSCNNCDAPFFSPDQSGVYSVNGLDPVSGCTDSLQFIVEVEPCEGSYFPNIFSPNDDGVNDDYRPFLSNCIVEVSTFKIFDRWGNMVHEQNDILKVEAKWDGSFKNRDAAIGLYAYFLSCVRFDGQTEFFEGDIMLLR